MQINNCFQMNGWEINKFLSVILSIQFALWGAISLDAVGLQLIEGLGHHHFGSIKMMG